jgi:hypothetical protein
VVVRKRRIEDDDGSDYEADREDNRPRAATRRRRSSKRTRQDKAEEEEGKGKEKEEAEEVEKAATSSTTGDTSSAEPAAAPDCSICFDAITVQGRLNSCEHPFCFECISTWAEKANVCPLCKRRFNSITKTAVPSPFLFISFPFVAIFIWCNSYFFLN